MAAALALGPSGSGAGGRALAPSGARRGARSGQRGGSGAGGLGAGAGGGVTRPGRLGPGGAEGARGSGSQAGALEGPQRGGVWDSRSPILEAAAGFPEAGPSVQMLRRHLESLKSL